MGRICVSCGRLFGCLVMGAELTCNLCRHADSCSIRNYFTTSRVRKDLCEDCLRKLAAPEKPLGGRNAPVTVSVVM